MQIEKLDAAIFALLRSGKIEYKQRDIVSNRLIQARLLAENGNTAEAQQVVTRAASIIGAWQEVKK